MAWIFAGERNTFFDELQGGGQPLLTRGTLRIEFALDPGTGRPRKLLDFSEDQGWDSRFTVYLNPDRSVSVEHLEGRSRSYVRVSPIAGGAEIVRLSYSWDSVGRLGLLTAEATESGAITQAVFSAPLPVATKTAFALARSRMSGEADSSVISVAVADHWHRIGPGPSIDGRALVDTPDGPRPIKTLRAGDLVTSREHGDVPIRMVWKAECPNVGLDRAIRLRAPYLGLERDVTVSGRQRVEIPPFRASDAIEVEFALVEANALGGHVIDPTPMSSISMTSFQLLLDEHDCVRVSGLWTETAYVAGLARVSDIVPSTHLAAFWGDAAPVHRRRAGAILTRYERMAIMDNFAA